MIAVQNTSQSANALNRAASVSWSHTVSSGDDRILVVIVHQRSYGQTAGSCSCSATYNGVAMTGQVSYNDRDYATTIFTLVNPPSGAHTVEVTFTWPTGGANSYIYGSAWAMDLTGVDQDEPVVSGDTANQSDSSISVPVSNGNSFVIHGITDNFDMSGTLTVGSGQTQVYEEYFDGDGAGGLYRAISYKESVASGSTVMEYTPSNTGGLANAGLALKEASSFVPRTACIF